MMGRKRVKEESRVHDRIYKMVSASTIPQAEIAHQAGLTSTQLYNFLYYSKATQLIMTERIADVLGYDLILKPKEA